jgi:hypothetical protein
MIHKVRIPARRCCPGGYKTVIRFPEVDTTTDPSSREHSRRRQLCPDFVVRRRPDSSTGRYVAAVPARSFSHSVTADADIEDVWKTLDLPETWENVGVVDRVFDPVFDDDRLVGFSFETVAAGKRYVGVATPATREEGRVMGWRIENSEVTGTLEVRLAPTSAGTEIEVDLHVESVGLLSTMFFPVVAGAVGSGLPRAVDAFANGLGSEAG